MQVPGFILRHTTIRTTKMWQFYIIITAWTAVYTTMQISILLFLDHALNSLFLAGLALAVGNICSLFLDGFFNSMQKRFSARNLFIFSIIGMMLSILIFMIFSNVFFVYIAAIFFSISFDLHEITAMSYIMAESLPANYGQNLSYKEVAHAIGLLFGLIISAVIISASYFIGKISDVVIQTGAEALKIQNQNFESSIFISQLIILFILFILFGLAYIFFDKDVQVISRDFIKTSFQELKSETIDGLRFSAIKVVEKTLEKLKQEPNQISLKSTEEKIGLNWNEILKDISSSLIVLKNIFNSVPRNISLIWSISSVTIYSYWDTFLAVFLPVFFTELLRAQGGWLANIPGSLLLLVFIIPTLILFPLFAKLGDKLGRHYFIYGGFIVTTISVFVLGFTPYNAFFIFIIAGFCISIGYVAGMSCAKADSASKINEFVAVSENKGEIDTNASAGPLMMINNFGNIIGPIVGGFFIDVVGFQGFFIFFGILLVAFLGYSFYKYKVIVKPNYVFESN